MTPRSRRCVDDGGRGEAREGAAQRRGHVGMAHGEPLARGPRRSPSGARATAGGRSSSQAKAVSTTTHLRHEGRAVAPVRTRVASTVPGAVAVERVVPDDAARERPGVGVEQELGGLKRWPCGGLVGAVHADSRRAGRARVRQSSRARPGRCARAARSGGAPVGSAGSKRQSSTRGGVLAEQREVHAAAVPGGAERVGRAGPDRGGRRAIVSGSRPAEEARPRGAGGVSRTECGWPCHGTGSLATPPGPFPTSLPP